MADYERRIRVGASPEAAFAFLADPDNLTRYVATVVKAEAQGNNTVRIAAEVQGRHEEGDALLQIDSARRRMDWSAPGDSDYSGSLQVAATEDGATVTLHIHVSREQDDAEINRVLEETAANIQGLLASS